MIYNQQNGPKMTGEQIQAYLARIGHTGPVTLDLAGLSTIHKAHQRAVPFENLDILAGISLSLDHEALFDKIIIRRRGGVCAELNTLYNWLLYSLGFQVTSYNSRIITGEKVEFRRHRVLGVRFGDKTYTTDVGSTMEYARMPLLLEEGVVQEDGSCRYRYDRHPIYGWVQMQQKPGLDWAPVLGFTEEPQLDVDFVTPLYWFETHPDSNMNKVPRVSYYTEDGILAIRAAAGSTKTRRLIERAGIIVDALDVTSVEQEKSLIRELFGLPTDYGS